MWADAPDYHMFYNDSCQKIESFNLSYSLTVVILFILTDLLNDKNSIKIAWRIHLNQSFWPGD